MSCGVGVRAVPMRRVWSTGDWEAAGEREGRGSRQKPLLVQVSASPCICSAPALRFYSSFYFCLDLWLTLNNFYLHGMCLFYECLRPAKTYFNLPLPSASHTYTSSFSPPSPCGLGAYGLAGQEIREICQPVVLNKHIFHFSLSSLLL